MKALLSISLSIFLFAPLVSRADEPVNVAVDVDSAICNLSEWDACYEKAINLHYGKDVPKDKEGAHKIFADLCEARMSKACHSAAMSISKFSSNPDFAKSMYFQKIGCETGTAQSCFVLGRNHEAPWKTDMKADHDKAKAYFNEACDLGMGLGCGYAKVKATGYRLQ